MTRDIQANQRRSYCRVERDLLFEYKPVDVHTVQSKSAAQAFGAEADMALVTELQRIDREAQLELAALASKDRALANHLSFLSQKIDLVARHCLFSRPSEHKASAVNLSEGGLGFDCDRALYKGNFLAVRLIFLPSYTPVIVFARVTRCESENGVFRTAAEFHKLSEQDRKILAREVFKTQVNNRNHLAPLERTDDQVD